MEAEDNPTCAPHGDERDLPYTFTMLSSRQASPSNTYLNHTLELSRQCITVLQNHVALPNQLTPMFSSLISIGILVVLCLLLSYSRHRGSQLEKLGIEIEKNNHTYILLQPLLLIATPIGSFWPNAFVHLARSTTSHQLSLSLDLLLEHVMSGELQLRSSTCLAPLLQGRLNISGFSTMLLISTEWKLRAMSWRAIMRTALRTRKHDISVSVYPPK
jgi:hypothetical protein